ncbi:MAG: SLC13 family permease [Bacteroides sp.]|jgi:di/tricarboxylate transporter|nr:SLC13 family permease [Bacteroides sp.]
MGAEILTVLVILCITVILLVFELIRIDVAALISMLFLGWSGVLEPAEMLSGFSSNAVAAMMAVMIMGHGIARTGIMDRFSRFVLSKAGSSRKKIIGLMSLSVGGLSGFIQNIGAAALFLPGILGISRRTKIPSSALIMPIGFAAILGGTLSMVGSGPLILINDLLKNAGLESYGLLSVTPVGLLLLFSGIAFFFLFGSKVLPNSPAGEKKKTEQEKLIEALQLPHNIWHYAVPESCPLSKKTPDEIDIWDRYGINILGISRAQEVEYAPWRETCFEAGQELALLGKEEQVKAFANDNHLELISGDGQFASLHDPIESGFAEVIVPPRSAIASKSIREFSLRKRFAVEPVMLFSKGEEIRGDFSDQEIRPGDTLIVFGLWEKIAELKAGVDFVVITSFQKEEKEQSKSWIALGCFVFAIFLALTGFSLSMAFLTGALAMVLTRVLSMEQAYRAIEWKVVFLLAGLIPLGLAMQKTGTAEYLAMQIMHLVSGLHPLFFLLTVALLSTLFSLFMTNVGAIVVLAPLVISMATMEGLDPRPLTLMAAVCAANSFVLPTHQVNALLMIPGGYKNKDYIRAGSGMTLIFLGVVISYFYLFLL